MRYLRIRIELDVERKWAQFEIFLVILHKRIFVGEDERGGDGFLLVAWEWNTSEYNCKTFPFLLCKLPPPMLYTKSMKSILFMRFSSFPQKYEFTSIYWIKFTWWILYIYMTWIYIYDIHRRKICILIAWKVLKTLIYTNNINNIIAISKWYHGSFVCCKYNIN